jgi:hypothetical protein
VQACRWGKGGGEQKGKAGPRCARGVAEGGVGWEGGHLGIWRRRSGGRISWLLHSVGPAWTKQIRCCNIAHLPTVLKWIVCENGVIQNNLLIGRTANSVPHRRSVTWYTSVCHLISLDIHWLQKIGDENGASASSSTGWIFQACRRKKRAKGGCPPSYSWKMDVLIHKTISRC